MSLRDRLAASARGDVRTADLLAYGGANSDAYDLVEQLTEPGPARFAAWSAWVIQTYADKLLVERATRARRRTLRHGCCTTSPRAWVERVRQAQADPSMQLIVAIPQPLPRPPVVPPDADQLAGMKLTLDAVLARAGADVDSCGDETLAVRAAGGARPGSRRP